MPAEIELSVLIPAFNEAGRLGATLTRVHEYLDESGVSAEIIVVDDGSEDGTRELAQRQLGDRPGRVIRTPSNRGKGHAFRSGVLAARGGWVLLSDADLSTPIEELETLMRAARDQSLAVAIGSRALPGSRVEVHQGPMREAMGKVFNLVIRGLLGLALHDTQCGFKLLDRAATRPVVEAMRVDGFAFDVELLVLSLDAGLTVGEIPVIWRNDPRSTVGMFSAPPAMLLDLLRIWWRHRI